MKKGVAAPGQAGPVQGRSEGELSKVVSALSLLAQRIYTRKHNVVMQRALEPG